MRIKGILLVAASLAFAAVTGVSSECFAQNAHFQSGPTVTTSGRQVCVSGDVAGLGNDNLDVEVTVVGEATTTCRNRGSNVAPGQGTVSGTDTASESFEPTKNGRVRFNLCETISPDDFTLPSAEDVCPNGNWTVDPIRSQNITVTGFEITVSHQGEILFQQSVP